MINFLVGRACSGKTFRTIKSVAESSVHKKTILIIPEQFTFESERAMLFFEDAVADNISVLSFSRLYEFVAEATGKGAAVCVSDFERMIMLKKALTATAEQLTVFSGYIKYRDFVKKISDTICDIKFAGANWEEILNASHSIGGPCGAKLKDIAYIMSAYDSLLSEKFIDPADKLSKLYDILCRFDYFKGTDVYFDSFTGFTGQQYKIIGKIIEQADNVTFSFPTNDPDDKSIGVFYNTNAAISKIKSLSAALGKKEHSFIKLENSFYSNNAMRDLEKLTYSTAEACLSDGNINIISCNTMADEALAACNIIRKEVKENGYRFKDFILVARNAEDYAESILRQCDKHDIACFSDKKFQITYTPLCAYVLSLIEISKSMSTENVLSFLKSGLTDFSEQEISELEDYIYIWDISASDWKDEWKMSVRGMTTDDDSKIDILRLNEINTTRTKIVDIVNDFKFNFNGSTEKRCTAIYKHLVKHGISEKLGVFCDKLKQDNEVYLSSVLKQSWDCFISVLDSLVRVLDKVDISTNDFLESLMIALDTAQISNIPQMLDEVTFGSADRIRPSKPKISIILGANHGVFPKYGSTGGLLASSDKDKLKNFDIILDDDVIKGAVEENYLVYSMLCCPVDKVYVLYSKTDSTGAVKAPSAFISRMLTAFTDLEIKDFSLSCDGDFVPATKASALSEIGTLCAVDFETIKESLCDDSDALSRIEILEKSNLSSDFKISLETADRLFGKKLIVSATNFDTYHRCGLSYLLKSGFSARKLEKADLGVLQRGTITHYVLEKIVEKFYSSLKNLTPEQLSTEVDMLIHDYFSMVKGSEKLMTARFSYLLSKISASIKKIVLHMAEEFAQSDFEPKFCELTVGERGEIPGPVYELDDGSKVSFEGKIDRIDVYKNYVRVVDYKTGKMTFTLSDVIMGLNMQMLLYLYAFVRNGDFLLNDPIPAGILYMPAKDSDKPTGMRMNGIILDEDEIRIAMEKENKGYYIPKSADSTSYLEKEGFELIFKKIDQLICDMGNKIKSGEFLADPVDGLTFDACKYCNYSGICRKSSLPHKQAENYTKEKTLEILKGDDDIGI